MEEKEEVEDMESEKDNENIEDMKEIEFMGVKKMEVNEKMGNRTT